MGNTHLYFVQVEQPTLVIVEISGDICVNFEVYTDDGDDVFVFDQDSKNLMFQAYSDKIYFIKLMGSANFINGDYTILANFHVPNCSGSDPTYSAIASIQNIVGTWLSEETIWLEAAGANIPITVVIHDDGEINISFYYAK